MGRLDASLLRYLTKEDFRILTAVEMGMKNHDNAVADDGYRLTNLGYDYLALKALSSRSTVDSLGNQVGVGKESDVYLAEGRSSDGGDKEEIVLKFHRLGRTSFRKLREKRDYQRGQNKTSYLYLSRIAAQKEYAFMKALFDRGLPVPKAIDVNRHCVAMSVVVGTPLCQLSAVGRPDELYNTLMNMISQLASLGLIHSDFNEFNLIVDDDGRPFLIDFPQMVSVEHENAEWYFDRDVQCVRDFFRRRFDYVTDGWPRFSDIEKEDSVDAEVHASGFSKTMEADLSGDENSGDEPSDSGEIEQLEVNTDELEREEVETEKEAPAEIIRQEKSKSVVAPSTVSQATIAAEDIRHRLKQESAAKKRQQNAKIKRKNINGSSAAVSHRRNDVKNIISEYSGWEF